MAPSSAAETSGASSPQVVYSASVAGITNAFICTYYQILSEDPKGTCRFYGNDSALVLNFEIKSQGQEMIGRMIEKMMKEENTTRIRIHKVRGCENDDRKSISILAFGEIGERRFGQHFMLVAQGVKSYYVQNSIFMFLDLAFICRDMEFNRSFENLSVGALSSTTI